MLEKFIRTEHVSEHEFPINYVIGIEVWIVIILPVAYKYICLSLSEFHFNYEVIHSNLLYIPNTLLLDEGSISDLKNQNPIFEYGFFRIFSHNNSVKIRHS